MAKHADSKSTQTTDEHGIVWVERYNVYTANIGRLIRAQVHYDNGGYTIQVGDLTLKNKAETAADGMARAVQLAQKQLSFLFNKEN